MSISRSLGKDGKPIRRYQYTAGGLGVVSGSSATDSFHLGPVGYRRRYYILRSHCPEVTGALNQNTFPIVPPNLSRERGSASRGSFLLLKILPRSLYPIYKKNAKDSKKKSRRVQKYKRTQDLPFQTLVSGLCLLFIHPRAPNLISLRCPFHKLELYEIGELPATRMLWSSSCRTF